MKLDLVIRWISSATMISALTIAPAAGQTVEAFYASTPLRIMVGYSPGGGFDAYARLLGRHISEHIPGNPQVVVENLPGAGSLRLANYLAEVAPRDGSTIGAVSAGLAVEPLLGEGAQFDSRDLTWIGSITDEVSVCAAWHEAGIESWDDVVVNGREFTVGGSGAASDVEVFTRMLIQLFEAPLNLISGYPGTSEMSLAVEQGEIDGRCGWFWSSLTSAHGDWLADGRLKVLVQLSPYSAPGLEDVPLITEYVRTEEQSQILNLLLSRMQTARPYVAPPELPADRAEALRTAFLAAASDPEFVAEAEQLGFAVNPMSGADLQALVGELFETPSEVVEQTRAIVQVQ